MKEAEEPAPTPASVKAGKGEFGEGEGEGPDSDFESEFDLRPGLWGGELRFAPVRENKAIAAARISNKTERRLISLPP
ncbi:MAG: hypothetical protein LBR71_03575 [Synergistaceae bacterium]|jgi:hypothetical protein|nr:hypothetical protein [Synergistaceae bacterium]